MALYPKEGLLKMNAHPFKVNICIFLVSLFLALLALPLPILAEVGDARDYGTDSGIMPFSDHPIGSFFTKNGKACTCHGKGLCIESGLYCNCLRYYPSGDESSTIDLLGVQCVAFARMCQYRLFGAIDYGESAVLFKNLLPATLYAGTWNALDAKRYISSASIGAHLRIGGHSMIIMSIGSDGFTTYECNSSSKGKECVVFSRTFTYNEFYSTYKNSDWKYINVPKNTAIFISEHPIDDAVRAKESIITPTFIKKAPLHDRWPFPSDKKYMYAIPLTK